MEITTSKEWREFYSSPGAIAECRAPSWLLDGCPKCGCTEWQVTNDYWAYCDDCGKGYPTAFPFTHAPLAHWGKDGFTCFMCRDTGLTKLGEPCDECSAGRVKIFEMNKRAQDQVSF